MLAVRPYTHTDHYWQVWFDTNRTIVAVFTEAGYPVPQTPVAFRPIGEPGGNGHATSQLPGLTT
jgi:small conductance mechanosensitive channel